MRKTRFLISAGPTRERIDPVRFISNRSSGKMGYALADAALAAGGEVLLVSGPVALEPPAGARLVRVESAAEMAREIRGNHLSVDIVIMAAAVADYRPLHCSDEKIKKDGRDLILRLEPTEDILKSLGASRSAESPLLVGFAAETENLLENAERKLRGKNLDWIIANDVSKSDAGFESDSNAAVMLSKDGVKRVFPLMEKSMLAWNIIEILLQN
jgi:phosphopantothenoylcysteine decarboxylase/phosphopantothenate--cysteine ligase